jgi:hypothetical protein
MMEKGGSEQHKEQRKVSMMSGKGRDEKVDEEKGWREDV